MPRQRTTVHSSAEHGSSLSQDDLFPIEIMNIADLKPHPRNYRSHLDDQLDHIKQSLGEHGIYRNVVIAQDNTILAGHGIIEAALQRGMTMFPARRLPYAPDDPRAIKVMIGDNEIPKRAFDDDRALTEMLKDLHKWDPDALLGTGFDAQMIAALADVTRPQSEIPEPEIDRAEELRGKWGIELGQMWQLGEHRILCGDCTDKESVRQLLERKQVSLVVIDPPYGVSYADKNAFLNTIGRTNRIETPIINDHATKIETQALWKTAFTNMATIMEPGAVVYCFMPQGGDQMMMMMMEGADIEPRHELIWVKNNHVLGRVDYAYKHEPILYAWKDGGHKFYGEFQTSILEYPKPQKADLHPTMKPVELVAKLIQNSSQPHENVYDGFLGSGTTLIACESLGRKCMGIEISPAYIAVCLQRYFDFTNIQPKLIEDS